MCLQRKQTPVEVRDKCYRLKDYNKKNLMITNPLQSNCLDVYLTTKANFFYLCCLCLKVVFSLNTQEAIYFLT